MSQTTTSGLLMIGAFALERWIKAADRTISASPREVYFVDHGARPRLAGRV